MLSCPPTLAVVQYHICLGDGSGSMLPRLDASFYVVWHLPIIGGDAEFGGGVSCALGEGWFRCSGLYGEL